MLCKLVIYDIFFLIFATKNPSVLLSCGQMRKHLTTSGWNVLPSKLVTGELRLIGSVMSSRCASACLLSK